MRLRFGFVMANNTMMVFGKGDSALVMWHVWVAKRVKSLTEHAVPLPCKHYCSKREARRLARYYFLVHGDDLWTDLLTQQTSTWFSQSRFGSFLGVCGRMTHWAILMVPLWLESLAQATRSTISKMLAMQSDSSRLGGRDAVGLGRFWP